MFCFTSFGSSIDCCRQVQAAGSWHYAKLVALSALVRCCFHVKIAKTLSGGSKLGPVRRLIYLFIFPQGNGLAQKWDWLTFQQLWLFHSCPWKPERTGAILLMYSCFCSPYRWQSRRLAGLPCTVQDVYYAILEESNNVNCAILSPAHTTCLLR